MDPSEDFVGFVGYYVAEIGLSWVLMMNWFHIFNTKLISE